MAERPVFMPSPDAKGFVSYKSLKIKWATGFATTQKKKNVKALHDAAEAIGISPVLEASTKSDEKLGQHLSAFRLKVKTAEGDLPLECVYQGSKVFERGGPYIDLFFADPRSAKRDPRLQDSGRLISFVFEGYRFPLEPKTIFYDWLYITAIFPHRDWLDRLSRYAAFSDIEFNPQKSLNCQARSLALFVSLKAKRLLDDAVRSPQSFLEIMSGGRPDTAHTVAGHPTAVINSSLQTESVAKIAADGGLFQSVSAKSVEAIEPLPASFHECPAIIESKTPDRSISAKKAALDGSTSMPISKPSIPPQTFETFLREKAQRKPKTSLQTRRRKTTPGVVGKSPNASE